MALFFGLRTYPNYDSYYQLLWGQQLAHGELPDYAVFRSPTPARAAPGTSGFARRVRRSSR